MSLPSSGSMTPRSSADDVVAGGQRSSAAGTCAGDSTGVAPCNLGSPVAEPQATVPSRLDILKALGDNTRYAIYLELARSPDPAGHRRDRPTSSICTSTPCGPTSSACARSACSIAHRRPAAGVGRPQHLLLAGRPTPRRWGSSRRRSRCWPACCSRVGGRGRARRRRLADAGRDQGAPTPASWPEGSRLPRGAHRRAGPSSASTPRRSTATDGATMAFAHCPFRELAEAHPDLVCGLHCGLVEGFVDGLGGAEVDAVPPAVDRTPCQVELAVTDEPPCRSNAPGVSVRSRYTCPSTRASRRTTVITAHRQRAGKVKELIAQEGDDELMLRVAVRPGGCSGFSYEMFFDTDVADDDHHGPPSASRSWSTRPAPSCSTGPRSTTRTA